MPYEVRTSVFEGPLDLLLHLVVEQEVDLYEVSISRIVDGYLEHLSGMEEVELELATEFLLVAAALVELKIRRLLPGRDDVDVDEELELCSRRDVLLARLLECRTYKQAAAALDELARQAERSRPRRAGMEDRFASLQPDALAGVSASDLRAALGRAFSAPPAPRVELDHVAPVRVSVRDAVIELAATLPALGEVGFRRLTEGVAERMQVIVRFLALLELYKEGLVELRQGATFGDLQVRWLGEEADHLVPHSVEEYQG